MPVVICLGQEETLADISTSTAASPTLLQQHDLYKLSSKDCHAQVSSRDVQNFTTAKYARMLVSSNQSTPVFSSSKSNEKQKNREKCY